MSVATVNTPCWPRAGTVRARPWLRLAASLAECTAMTVRWLARQHGRPLEHVEVCVDHARRSVDGAPPRGVFAKTVLIRRPLLTDNQRFYLLDVAGKCPVQRVLEGGSVIATTADPTNACVGP